MINIRAFVNQTDSKEALKNEYNALVDTLKLCKSAQFHTELRIKETKNQMAEIMAKLDSLNAFGNKE